MYHQFSILGTIKTSWKVLKRNFVTLIIYCIISLICDFILERLNILLFINDSLVSEIILYTIQLLIQSWIVLSFYKLILILIDKEYYEFSFKDILPSIKMAFNFVLIGLIFTVLIIVLFIINTLIQDYYWLYKFFNIVEVILIVYLLIRAIFCVCFIVDDDSKPIESLRQSFSITKDNFFNTFSVFLIIIGLLVVTLIPLVSITNFFLSNTESEFDITFYIWVAIIFPAVQVIIMVTYRKLVYSHQDVDDDIAETN